MSWASPNSVPRRALLTGGLAVLGVGVVAFAASEWSMLFGPRRKPTPFDDLLSVLPDRDNAVALGTAVLAQQKLFEPQAAASQLRARMKNISLADAMSEDLREGHLMEVKGWVLPETLTTLCALADKVS